MKIIEILGVISAFLSMTGLVFPLISEVFNVSLKTEKRLYAIGFITLMSGITCLFIFFVLLVIMDL